MTEAEKEEANSNDIVEMYQKKDKSPHVKKKKTLFDELWERDHPEEASEMKQKELEEQQKELLKKKQ